MATMNPVTAQGMAGGMGQDPDAATEGQEQEQGGYCIEIHVSADGKISVEVEDEAEEAQEEGGEAGEADTGKPAANIKEALTMALEIYKNNGEEPDDQGAEQEFSAGLGSRAKGY